MAAIPISPNIRTNYHIGIDQFYPDANNLRSLSTAPANSVSKYNSLRGMFVPKLGSSFDISRQFTFQFNPEEINITKDVSYTSRNYTGFDYTDYIWAYGGEKSVQFSLFLDASAGFYNSYFRQAVSTDQSNIDLAESKKPRGVLDDCELLESFLRPDVPQQGAIKTPKFSSGGIVPPNQFYPPPILVFIYGDFYLEGILRTCDFKYSTYKKNLIPTRAEINVSFTVFEQVEVSINSFNGQLVSNAVTSQTNFLPV